MSRDKVLSYIGLAARGRNLASGEFSTEKAVKTGKAELVIVASDASDNTKKNFRDMCNFYEVPYMEYGDKAQLGHAIGKELRASMALLNHGLANAVLKQVQSGGSKKYGENENL